MSLLPMADACLSEKDKITALKIVHERQLVGLCNDTKWNSVLTVFRNNKWNVCNRSKWVSGYISDWENDWLYHLPFPFVGAEWLDIEFTETIFDHRKGIEIETIDRKEEILQSLAAIGLEFEACDEFVRIWGYAPKCYEQFGVV